MPGWKSAESRGTCVRQASVLPVPPPPCYLFALPMKSRLRFLITAAFLCHLLLSPGLVTSQLPPDSVLGFALAPSGAFSSSAALPDDPQHASSSSSLPGFG